MGVTKAMTRHLAIFTTCPERIAIFYGRYDVLRRDVRNEDHPHRYMLSLFLAG